MMIDRGPFVSIPEAAELLGCTVKETKELIREGKLTVKKVGPAHIIPREAITEYLTRKNLAGYTISSTEK
ncbi:MAG: helix-turn-helix domain-containing protein [Dehalococcoidia bacterium]|nr:helix-turn-helix domain-containing protein [Dehalococcoidia bacterium]